MIAAHDSTLNRFIPISDGLARALRIARRGGEAERGRVAYGLAEGLDFSTAHLGREAFEMLLELLNPLEAFWQSTSDNAPGEAIRVVHEVVQDVAESTKIDTILAVFEQVGLSNFQPPLRVQSVQQFQRDLRLRLRETLDPRVFRMIDMWRLRDWDDVPAEQTPRVIRSSGARPMSEPESS